MFCAIYFVLQLIDKHIVMKFESLLKAVDTFYKFAQEIQDSGIIAEIASTTAKDPINEFLFKKVVPDQAPKYPCELEFTLTVNIPNVQSLSKPKLTAALTKAESFVPEKGKQPDYTLGAWVQKTGVYNYIGTSLVSTVGAALAQQQEQIKSQATFPYTGSGKVVISIDWD